LITTDSGTLRDKTSGYKAYDGVTQMLLQRGSNTLCTAAERNGCCVSKRAKPVLSLPESIVVGLNCRTKLAAQPEPWPQGNESHIGL